MRHAFARVKKAIGAALGGLVGTQVDWITNEIFVVDLPSQVDNAIAVLLAFAGAYIAKENAPKREDVVDNPHE